MTLGRTGKPTLPKTPDSEVHGKEEIEDAVEDAKNPNRMDGEARMAMNKHI
jgi:hypothetical protein